MADNDVSNDAEQAKTETVKVPEKKKSNKTLWIVLGIVLFIFVVIPGLLFTAGGIFLKSRFGSDKATEKTLEGIVSKATDSKVNLDSKNGSVTVKGKDGETMSVGSSRKLPDDFPKNDIPFIAQKEVTFVITTSSEGKKNWSVTTTVDKSFEEATTYFDGKIKTPDYESVSSYGSGDSQSYSGKGSKYSLYVTVTKGKDGEPTDITYIVTEQ